MPCLASYIHFACAQSLIDDVYGIDDGPWVFRNVIRTFQFTFVLHIAAVSVVPCYLGELVNIAARFGIYFKAGLFGIDIGRHIQTDFSVEILMAEAHILVVIDDEVKAVVGINTQQAQLVVHGH